MKLAFFKPALLVALAALSMASCSSAPSSPPPQQAGRTFPEVSLLEQICMAKLQTYLIGLDAPHMDTFFSAALNGLVSCEASSGLAHAPTKDVTRWLVKASGKRTATAIPKTPPAIAKAPAVDDGRLGYQRACVAYMRNYVPASIANAGDDPDVAAAFIFNVLEQCDSDAGFATIAPSDLAAIMQSKHLL